MLDLHSPDAAATALHVFFRVADRWGLSATERQTLLGVSGSVFSRWRTGAISAALDPATAERLSYIFRIFEALQVLIPIQERADAWVRQPNTAPLFAGACALDRMLAGRTDDLRAVADFLDAHQGGDFA